MSLEIWDKLRTPPKEMLKPIVAGRLKGMTDIKPQWRYKIMTETFGMCGIGWKYTIDSQRVVDGVGDHKFAFADVSLYIKDGENWSEAIPGTGGSMLIAKENAGPYMNDEAFKMAVTDALSVAMSRIGVAADIYMGQGSGSKYSSPAPSTNARKQPPQTAKFKSGKLDPPPKKPEMSVQEKIDWFAENKPEILEQAMANLMYSESALLPTDEKEMLEIIEEAKKIVDAENAKKKAEK